MVHFLWVKPKPEKPRDGAELLDDSDCSETWSLPEWTELQRARIIRDRKIKRLKRLRRRRERERQREEARNNPDIAVQAVGSTSTMGSNEEEEDDLPEELKERGQWNNSFEFLLSIISMSVGLGNVYRFPFVAYQNGGGAFLIPYIIVVTMIGRPLYLLELAIGQFCSFGQVKVWNMAPILRGVGYGSAMGSFVVVTYYSAMMGTTFNYLFESLRLTLPWTVCNPEWAGKNVCEEAQATIAKNKSLTMRHLVNLPELFFNNKINQEKAQIDDGIGTPLLVPTGCMFVSWVLIYIIIARGVESSGKAAYITTIYPFAVLFIMLIISSTKQGAAEGMLYFITPQWSKMLDPNVWFAAVSQCFFSLSVGFGPIINYASFNPFHHNIYKDVFVVSIMDTLASFIAGLTVFATLGSLARTMGKPISEVISGSPGLIFIVFSDAIAGFKYVPQIIAVMFFTMLLTLAAGSAVAWQLAVISVICDGSPRLSRYWMTILTCVIGFLVSLIYVTPGGQFMVTLVDYYGGNMNIYILTLLECIGIAWVYGLKNLVVDLEFMLNKKVSKYWTACWGYITPAVLIIVMVYSLLTGEKLKHNGHEFPISAIVCGSIVTALTLLTIPAMAIYALYTSKGSCKQRWVTSISPQPDFGPQSPSVRERWRAFKEEKQPKTKGDTKSLSKRNPKAVDTKDGKMEMEIVNEQKSLAVKEEDVFSLEP